MIPPKIKKLPGLRKSNRNAEAQPVKSMINSNVSMPYGGQKMIR